MMSNPRVTVFDVSNDLKWDKNLQSIRKGTAKDIGEIIFDPDVYKQENLPLDIDTHRLDEEMLL